MQLLPAATGLAHGEALEVIASRNERAEYNIPLMAGRLLDSMPALVQPQDRRDERRAAAHWGEAPQPQQHGVQPDPALSFYRGIIARVNAAMSAQLISRPGLAGSGPRQDPGGTTTRLLPCAPGIPQAQIPVAHQ